MVKNLPQCRTPGLGRAPGRKECQPTPVLLPGSSPWTEEVVGYSPCGCKELDVTE